MPFYATDEQAHLTRYDVPVYRDRYGHICALALGDRAYKFLLDSEGNVLAVLDHSVYLPYVRK